MKFFCETKNKTRKGELWLFSCQALATLLTSRVMNDFLESVHKSFVGHGWRVTAGVRNIANILSSTKKPITSAEICATLDKAGRPIDLTTVYRILERMVAINLIHTLNGKFIICSDPSNRQDSHHFLLCDDCGEAEEIFLDYFPSIEQQLKREKKFSLREVNMSFHGLCSNCKQ